MTQDIIVTFNEELLCIRYLDFFFNWINRHKQEREGIGSHNEHIQRRGLLPKLNDIPKD